MKPSFLPSRTVTLFQPHIQNNLITRASFIVRKSTALTPTTTQSRLPSQHSFTTKPTSPLPNTPPTTTPSSSPSPHHHKQPSSPNSTAKPNPGSDLGGTTSDFLKIFNEASPAVRWTLIVALSILGTAETITYGRWGWSKLKPYLESEKGEDDADVEDVVALDRAHVEKEGGR